MLQLMPWLHNGNELARNLRRKDHRIDSLSPPSYNAARLGFVLIRLVLMRSTSLLVWFLTLGAAALAGCSSKQLYQTGQAWQEHECFRIDDVQARNRCLSNASVSYEQYKQDVESGPVPK